MLCSGVMGSMKLYYAVEETKGAIEILLQQEKNFWRVTAWMPPCLGNNAE
jgi:hypothetical protein